MNAVPICLRLVKGLDEDPGHRIVTARRPAPFRDLADCMHRTDLDAQRVTALAEAGAFDAWTGGDRRDALWQGWAHVREPRDGLQLVAEDDGAEFTPLAAFELVAWDYRAAQHSPRGHPLEALRPTLARQRLLAAEDVRARADGERVATAGLVICRQRPGTAKGVVFLTLEDETGFVNVVVWERTFTKFAVEVKAEPFLAVRGKVQKQDGVVHVVADRLWVPSTGERPASTGSRDFH